MKNCGGDNSPASEAAKLWRAAFTELRVQLRQMLYPKGVPSNLAVSD